MSTLCPIYVDSDASAHAIHVLVQSIINTGTGYNARCALARAQRGTTGGSEARAHLRAMDWLRIVKNGAQRLHREEPDFEPRFTTLELLCAAASLASYYAEHVAESGVTS